MSTFPQHHYGSHYDMMRESREAGEQAERDAGGTIQEEGKAPIQADIASLQKQLLAEQERGAELVKLVKCAYLEGNLKAMSLHSRWESSDAFKTLAALSPPPVVGPRQD